MDCPAQCGSLKPGVAGDEEQIDQIPHAAALHGGKAAGAGAAVLGYMLAQREGREGHWICSGKGEDRRQGQHIKGPNTWIARARVDMEGIEGASVPQIVDGRSSVDGPRQLGRWHSLGHLEGEPVCLVSQGRLPQRHEGIGEWVTKVQIDLLGQPGLFRV